VIGNRYDLKPIIPGQRRNLFRTQSPIGGGSVDM
jgi:hypothetical protein